jgi:DNA-binding HxlR family transcriptional regulator
MGEAYEPRSGCPINAAIEVFGDRWSLLVLRDIVFGDRRYFRELQAGSEEGIASNILADRLKRLVELGLLTREDTRAGQRARYSLTEPAIQLVPVFAQLGSWGLRHRPTSRALRVRAELREHGGPALWQEFMDELRRPSCLTCEPPPRHLEAIGPHHRGDLAMTPRRPVARVLRGRGLGCVDRWCRPCPLTGSSQARSLARRHR